MQKASDQIKIVYGHCQKGQLHEGQPLNNVCLNKECASSSLICSICKTQSHADHNVTPLKFYISQLAAKYQNGKSDVNDRLDALDRQRDDYLLAVQQIVSSLSDSFRSLEHEIITRFDHLKDAVLQQEYLRNQFSNFYEALSKENHPELMALVKEYLPKKQLSAIPKIDKLRDCRVSLDKTLYDLIRFYKLSAEDSEKEKGLEQQKANPMNIMYSPENIAIVGNTIQPKSDKAVLCLVGNKISLENFKIKMKIQSANPLVTVGIMPMKQFKDMKYLWVPGTYPRIYWISSQTTNSGANFNSMTPFLKGDGIDLSFKKNQLIVNNKRAKNYASFTIKPIPDIQWYFFIALEKQCSVELLPQKK